MKIRFGRLPFGIQSNLVDYEISLKCKHFWAKHLALTFIDPKQEFMYSCVSVCS